MQKTTATANIGGRRFMEDKVTIGFFFDNYYVRIEYYLFALTTWYN